MADKLLDEGHVGTSITRVRLKGPRKTQTHAHLIYYAGLGQGDYLQWLGHILRMGPEMKLKQAVFEIFKSSRPGDLLMDAPKTKSW